MNVRLSQNSVRFRVDREELDRLRKGTSLEWQVAFPGGGGFAFRILPWRNMNRSMSVDCEGSELRLSVSLASLDGLYAKKGKEAFLEAREDCGAGRFLDYQLEVDFKAK